jgi:hypothetical protein
MFFNQAIGRVIRVIGSLEYQPAFCYIPRDPDLLRYAESIMRERDHFLRQMEDKERREMLSDPVQPMLFVPLSASDMQRKDTIGTLGNFTDTEIALAQDAKMRHGWPIPAEMIAEIWREQPGQAKVENGHVAPAPDGKRPSIVTESDKRTRLKKSCKSAAGALHHQSGGLLDYPFINQTCNFLAGVNSIDLISTDGLQDRWEFLVEWRRAYEAGNGPSFDGERVFRAIAQRNAEQRRDRAEARP